MCQTPCHALLPAVGLWALSARPGARLPVARGAGRSPAPQSFRRAVLPGDAPGPPGHEDELLDAVWPETTVSDAVGRVAIGALGKVVSANPSIPAFQAALPEAFTPRTPLRRYPPPS